MKYYFSTVFTKKFALELGLIPVFSLFVITLVWLEARNAERVGEAYVEYQNSVLLQNEMDRFLVIGSTIDSTQSQTQLKVFFDSDKVQELLRLLKKIPNDQAKRYERFELGMKDLLSEHAAQRNSNDAKYVITLLMRRHQLQSFSKQVTSYNQSLIHVLLSLAGAFLFGLFFALGITKIRSKVTPN